MPARTVVTHSAEETVDFGRQLGRELASGTLVLLRGDLGAGKTTLVKGLAESFSAARADDVTSPTFTLVHEYRGREVTLFHIDLYRIDTPRELESLALQDLMDERAIVLVEWGEKFAAVASQAAAEISIEHAGGDERRITFLKK